MRRTLFALAAAVTLVLASTAPAAAVTYGEPDAGEHPYVGLIALYAGVDENGDPIQVDRCSGTLLSPTVMLTAGHCTAGTDLAQVYMEENVSANPGYPSAGGIIGTPYTHPGFDSLATMPNTSDLGIVVLDEPYYLDFYGALPDLGVLDLLATERGKQDIFFEVIGYGLQGIKPDFLSLRDRYKAFSKLNNLRSAWTDGFNMQTSNAPGIGGGVCAGDSGGPVLFNDSNVIVGVTSFGLNQNCKGNDFAYRVDIANAQDFIYGFL